MKWFKTMLVKWLIKRVKKLDDKFFNLCHTSMNYVAGITTYIWDMDLKDLQLQFPDIKIIQDDLNKIKETGGFGQFQLFIVVLAQLIEKEFGKGLKGTADNSVEYIINYIKERIL